MMPWWIPSNPNKFNDVPWLHPAIVAYMDMLIQPDWTILEHGSGGSTLWLAARAKRVISYEHDEAWLEKVAHATPHNVEMRNGKLPKIVTGDFDMLFIDGKREERGGFIKAAKDLVRPGGVVILDNASQPLYASEKLWLRSIAEHYVTFDMNPPNHLHAITEFYRMPGSKSENWI